MAGLEEVKFLRHLCLYSNEITTIDNLDHMSELELLWLNDNHISAIQVLIAILLFHICQNITAECAYITSCKPAL